MLAERLAWAMDLTEASSPRFDDDDDDVLEASSALSVRGRDASAPRALDERVRPCDGDVRVVPPGRTSQT